MKTSARWQWIKNKGKTDCITQGDVCVVYGLDRCVCTPGICKVMCKNTPSCLNGIVTTDILDSTLNGHCENVLPLMTTGQTRNGLRNYGNTCYLNAFLQLYFRFKKLRRAIYQLSSDGDETGVTYQLKLIFGQLQLSQSGIVDPGGLIEALRLSDTEQQDAPEFHCLFMNLLGARFRQLGLSVIDDLLRGEYIYETRCSTCGFVSQSPSNFMELSIKVSSKTLVECIRNHLKEELLTGDNQYACSQCGMKRDGIRRTYIKRAPPLLCIQLLRFTYDARTGLRKKQKAVISLPDQLELRPIVKALPGKLIASDVSIDCLGEDCEPQHRLYRLCGLLLHIGNQPTSGHYIAVLRDRYSQLNSATSTPLKSTHSNRSDECWTVCNDTDIFTIPSDQFILSKVNGTAKSLQSYLRLCGQSKSVDDSGDACPSQVTDMSVSTEHRPPKRLHNDLVNNSQFDHITATPTTNRYNSTNAYMVFYEAIEDDELDQDTDVPGELYQLINKMNDSAITQMKTEEANKTMHLNNLRQLIIELVPPDFTQHTNDDGTVKSLEAVSLVPTKWLSDCLNNKESFAKNNLFNIELTDNDNSQQINRNNEIGDSQFEFPRSSFPTCFHGHVPVDLPLSSYRAVSTKGIKKLLVILSKSNSNDYSKLISNLDRLQPCKLCVTLNAALFNVDRTIKELGKDIDHFLRLDNSSNQSKQMPLMAVKHETKTSNSKMEEQIFYWIGKRSLRQWRNLVRVYTNALYATNHISAAENGVLPSTTFNTDIFCPHGRVRVTAEYSRYLPSSLWHRLIALFPRARIPTIAVCMPDSVSVYDAISYVGVFGMTCSDCNAIQNDLDNRVSCESRLLSDLCQAVLSPRPLNTLLALSNSNFTSKLPDSIHPSSSTSDEIPPNAVYLASMEFIIQWRRFLRNPTTENIPTSIPSGLHAKGVLCEHQLLWCSWHKLLEDSVLYPLISYEWNILSRAYPVQLEDNHKMSTAQISDIDTQCCLYLLPSSTETGSWELGPANFVNICPICQSTKHQEAKKFHNIQLRICLTTGLDEAMQLYLQSVQNKNLPALSAQSTQVNANVNDRVMRNNNCAWSINNSNGPNNPDQVGVSQSMILTVDAKLVYSPHVILPNLVTERFMEPANPNDPGTYSGKRPRIDGCVGSPTRHPSIAHSLSDGDDCVNKLNTSLTETTKTLKSCDESLDHSVSTSNQNCVLRRSGRQRYNTNDILVKASSGQTLMDVKLQLMQLLRVLPSEQHFLINGVEQCNDSQSLLDLGICPTSLLYAWTDRLNSTDDITTDMSVKPHEMNGVKPNVVPADDADSIKSVPPVSELGFKGTRLLGN